MTAVCLITLKWEKPLRMGPYQYPSQTVFWDAAYLLSPISWLVMKSLRLNPGCCVPIQGRILKRTKLYSIIVYLEKGEYLRTALGSLRQDRGFFVEQFKQKLKQCRKLYKQLLLCTIISGRQILLVTAQLALWTAWMAQEVFYQESGAESLQLMKGPVLFVAYPPQEAQDIIAMLWKCEGLESLC